MNGSDAAPTRPLIRRRSDVALFAFCIGLAAFGVVGLSVYLDQWTREHNAALARACAVCEDTYGGVIPAFVGFYQTVLVVFGVCALALPFGARWYWRVPLALVSTVVMIGAILFGPCLLIGGFGFVAALRPSGPGEGVNGQRDWSGESEPAHWGGPVG